MTDDEKKQAAINLLISKHYPRVVAEAFVKVWGADRVLENAGAFPTEVDEEAAAPLPRKASTTHKPECGDVGETGDHGDIGENAA